MCAPAEVLSLGEKFRKAVADHPEVPRPRFMMQRRTCVYARKSDWEEPVRLSNEYGRRFENLFQNVGGVTNGFPEAIDLARVANSANYDPQATLRNLLFGTPDEIIEKLQVYQDAGVDQVSINISFGLPFEMQKTSLRLFIDEVIPAFPAREQSTAAQPMPVGAA